MNGDRLIELSKRVRESKGTGQEDCSEFLRSELEVPAALEERLSIYGMLTSELQSHGRLDEAEAVIRERIALAPDMPDAWISLALHFSRYAGNTQKAVSAINAALERSHKCQFFDAGLSSVKTRRIVIIGV